ncbi:MAG TPA: dTMP kinase [Vicinamibacterales bacterium]|nr:dTMP kinase [Vicinamibacterales bacterium]
MDVLAGRLIAFEGLDQSGKQTQAGELAAWLRGRGRRVETVSFPDHKTPIGAEIARALAGARDYPPDVMQLLYVANRFEWKPRILEWLAAGAVVLSDRYLASSIAYGETQGLDPEWLTSVQAPLPQPDLTILLDIAPETAARRKASGRDRFERDLALLGRVRQSYLRQAARHDWVRIDGERDRALVARDVAAAVDAWLTAADSRSASRQST